jgi:hypothetical protein
VWKYYLTFFRCCSHCMEAPRGPGLEGQSGGVLTWNAPSPRALRPTGHFLAA